jgi:hypothetical protein
MLTGALIALAPQGIAQAMAQNAGVEGAKLRRVASADQARLTYEYQTGAVAQRISIDPSSLVNDIERARKRASVKQAPVKQAAAVQPAKTEARQPEIAQADIPAPVVEAASTPREDRKVRVIPLYNVPKVD